jgi:hypothetical protein
MRWLPGRLAYSKEEKTSRRQEFSERKPSLHLSNFVDRLAQLLLWQIPESAPSKFEMTNSALVLIKIARSVLCAKETQNHMRTMPNSKASSVLASF